MNPQVLTVKEVCAVLRVHHATIYRLLKQGKLRSFKVGSDHRFFRTEIEKFTNPNGVAQKTEDGR